MKTINLEVPMSIKLSPEFCLWCSGVRVVDNKCLKCCTRYGNRAEKRAAPRRRFVDQMMTSRAEMKKIRTLRFSWEM